MKEILKTILVFIHKLIVYFMAFGFLLPHGFLLYFLLTWPLVYLHWQFNNNRCVLTELEYYLDDTPYPPTVDKDHNNPFVMKLLNDFGIHLSDSQVHYGIMYGFTVSWMIGAFRYI